MNEEPSTMPRDEFQERWAAYDRKLDQALRLNRRALERVELAQTRSPLQRLRAFLGFELVLDAVPLGLLGSFIADQFAHPRFVVPALVLDLAALAALLATIRQLMLAGSVDYTGPVAAIQRRLEALRALRIRTTQAIFLLSPLLWTPLLIVGLRALFGVDAYAVLGIPYLLANLAFGVAFALATLWVCRRFADRLDRSPFVQRLARDVAGANLTAALEKLEVLAAFEREEGGP